MRHCTSDFCPQTTQNTQKKNLRPSASSAGKKNLSITSKVAKSPNAKLSDRKTDDEKP